MSKKTYDLSKLENELKGASAFFKSTPTPDADTNNTTPTIEVTASPAKTPNFPAQDSGHHTRTTSQPSEVVARTPVRSVRPVLPVRRQMIRHPFELYQDQVESLRQLAANDRMRGGAGSMSAMVRDAIDRLIDEQSKSPD